MNLNPKRITSAIAFLCFLASFTIRDRPAIAGGLTPPAAQQSLSGDTAERVTGFFEWALNVRLTPEQRAEYATMLARDCSNQAQRKSTAKLLELMNKADALSPEKRRGVQAQLEPIIVAGLRENTSDPEAKWMLAIYQAAQTGPASPPSIANRMASTGLANVSDTRLVGKWRATHAAAVQYKDSYTGALAPTSGSSFAYEFRPDGTYNENGTLQVTTYGCTSSVFRDNSGRYRFEAGRLFLQPERGLVKSQTCGGPQKEKPADLAPRVYAYKLETDNGHETLVVQDVDGKNRPDFYRREQ